MTLVTASNLAACHSLLTPVSSYRSIAAAENTGTRSRSRYRGMVTVAADGGGQGSVSEANGGRAESKDGIEKGISSGRGLPLDSDSAGGISLKGSRQLSATQPIRGDRRGGEGLASGGRVERKRSEWKKVKNKNVQGTRADRRADTRGLEPPDGVAFEDVAIQPVSTNLHPSQLIPEDSRRPDVPDTFKKKPVALLVGYVGTGYCGNTTNPVLPRGFTVDDELEDAAFKAGGILLSNYRSRALSRLKWSRSSRTDKGVSSLATVVSLRMEVNPAAWDEDIEGGSIAASLNKHLPSEVRVFGVYSVPKGFQARRVCTQRTYDYLLPARVLGLGPPGDKADNAVAWPGTEAAAGRTDEEILAAFRAALRVFEGSHPFHNYTRRSYYSPAHKSNRMEVSFEGGKKKRTWKPKSQKDDDDDDASDGSTMEEELEVNEEEEEAKERESFFLGKDDKAEAENSMGKQSEKKEEDERVGYSGPDYIGTRRDAYYWLMGRDDDDLIGIKHSRKVSYFIAGDVETTSVASVDDGEMRTESFVRVTVCGDSFMLYQIRKMIATAVAVALGHIPQSFLPVTLSRHARAATPLAPASTLYLRRAQFMTFRVSNDVKAEPSSPPRLERLEPSAHVQSNIDSFQRAVLVPAMAPAFQSDEWAVFTANLFKLRINANMDAVEAMTSAHGKHVVMQAEQKMQRAEDQAREAERVQRADEQEAARASKEDASSEIVNDDEVTDRDDNAAHGNGLEGGASNAPGSS